MLGLNIDTYRKTIKFQLTLEMNWLKIKIDHVKPICFCDTYKHGEKRKAFNWKNTQNLYYLLKQFYHQKDRKFNLLEYRLQFIRAYQFLKLNADEK